ncbi:hypothetical protein L596_025358 [Steinernema carpocapsae]|uniref:MARVEL domain-containing protein n=1 Tax=Steinernema carpocapsae TaxID=34508 RepID=A0A4U5M7I8_STECR|nr:hypothetical protein L596_025358 [Steinernema carpocapsae]
MGRFISALITTITSLASVACAIYSAFGLQYFLSDLRRSFELIPRALHDWNKFLECATSIYVYFLCIFGLASAVLCIYGIAIKKAKKIRLFSTYWTMFGLFFTIAGVGIINKLYQLGENYARYHEKETYIDVMIASGYINAALFSGFMFLAARATAKNVEEPQCSLP